MNWKFVQIICLVLLPTLMSGFAETTQPGEALKDFQARAEWIVPNMFTYYATGQKSLDEAATWAETELQRIYTSKA